MAALAKPVEGGETGRFSVTKGKLNEFVPVL